MHIESKLYRRHRVQVRAAKAVRDKETFFVQRATLAKIETEAIQRYIKKTASSFENKWSAYESQLEKYLTLQGNSGEARQFKDWVQRKDPTSEQIYWQNSTTMETSFKHPGIKIFEMNKKILRQKAEEELTGSLGSILDRNRTILETVMFLKKKVTKECAQTRKDITCAN